MPLNLRNTTGPYSDTNRNGVLSWDNVDQNFIFLKGRDIDSFTITGTTLYYHTLNGDVYPVDLDPIVDAGNDATNGLTLSGGTTKLGGTLIEDTTIDGDGFDLNLTNNGTIFLLGGSGVNVTTTEMTQNYWQSYGPVYKVTGATTSFTWPKVTLSQESSVLELEKIQTTPFSSQFQQRVSLLGDNGMVVKDDFNSKGLEYFTAYEPNFTDYSLITKKFFDDNVPSDTYLTGATLNSTTLTLGRNQGLVDISVDLFGLTSDITGTTNYIPKYNTTGLTESQITDDGTLVSIGGNLEIQGQANNPFFLSTGSTTHIPNWDESGFQKRTPPTLTASVGAVDIITFLSDGTYLYGLSAPDFQ
jgi:hypothetical protein